MVSMEPIAMGGLLAFGLAVLAAGGVMVSVGLDRVRTARTLRASGPIPIGDVPGADELVEFEGTARSTGETLEAPLSGESCLAYTVQSRTQDGSTADATWRVDGQATASVPFAVEDDSDRVAVDPTNAVLSLDGWDPDATDWTDRTILSAGSIERLHATGLPDDGPASETVRQYREFRLGPGGDVHVFGGSVADSSDGGSPVTVGGGDWLEITAGGTDRGGATVVADRRRSGSLYVIFGGLIAVPGVGFTLAGIAGLMSTLIL